MEAPNTFYVPKKAPRGHHPFPPKTTPQAHAGSRQRPAAVRIRHVTESYLFSFQSASSKQRRQMRRSHEWWSQALLVQRNQTRKRLLKQCAGENPSIFQPKSANAGLLRLSTPPDPCPKWFSYLDAFVLLTPHFWLLVNGHIITKRKSVKRKTTKSETAILARNSPWQRSNIMEG